MTKHKYTAGFAKRYTTKYEYYEVSHYAETICFQRRKEMFSGH